jgi:DNA-binding NtrC family response regulator
LIIDDQPSVAQALRRMLTREHQVEVTNDPRSAIAMLSAEQEDFDIILCDLMMPVISGDEVYGEVVKERPELAERFIFMTGGAFTARGSQFLEQVYAPVLHKPFNVARVRDLVRSHAARQHKTD